MGIKGWWNTNIKNQDRLYKQVEKWVLELFNDHDEALYKYKITDKFGIDDELAEKLLIRMHDKGLIGLFGTRYVKEKDNVIDDLYEKAKEYASSQKDAISTGAIQKELGISLGLSCAFYDKMQEDGVIDEEGYPIKSDSYKEVEDFMILTDEDEERTDDSASETVLEPENEERTDDSASETVLEPENEERTDDSASETVTEPENEERTDDSASEIVLEPENEERTDDSASETVLEPENEEKTDDSASETVTEPENEERTDDSASEIVLEPENEERTDDSASETVLEPENEERTDDSASETVLEPENEERTDDSASETVTEPENEERTDDSASETVLEPENEERTDDSASETVTEPENEERTETSTSDSKPKTGRLNKKIWLGIAIAVLFVAGSGYIGYLAGKNQEKKKAEIEAATKRAQDTMESTDIVPIQEETPVATPEDTPVAAPEETPEETPVVAPVENPNVDQQSGNNGNANASVKKKKGKTIHITPELLESLGVENTTPHGRVDKVYYTVKSDNAGR